MIGVLQMITRGGAVVRFHTKPILKPETVAEHSYLVAWLATLMYDHKPSAILLLACLAHDLPEYELGDMPSPAKRKLGVREAFKEAERGLFRDHGMPHYEAELSEEESEALHFCDNLAGYLKCLFEIELGNQHLRGTASRYAEYLQEIVCELKHLDRQKAEHMMSVVHIHSKGFSQ